MNKTIIAIAAAMAVGGVTAQAKAPRGTSDALFPYMPKARAEVQQDGFGKPDAFQAKAPKGAVKVGAFKTLNPHVLSKSSESGYLNAPDGSTWFFSIDYKTSETNSIQGFKITVFDNLLQEVGSVEDEIQLGENETRASVTSDWNTVADEGDIVGAFNLGNLSDPENVRYAVRNVGDSQVLVPAMEGTELTKQATDYLFYYPYNPEMTLEKARNLEHSVMVDQQQDGAFESSDLLWDVAHASETKCMVALDHAMASITIIAQAEGNDFFNNVKILGQSFTASGIDLTVDGPDLLTYGTDDAASDITALYAPYSTDADHYRAVIPAHRIIKAGSKIISHYTRDSVHEYTLRRDLELLPGRNYVFTLLRDNSPSPDVTDDDSWVLDVLDPQTGQPVGLLCREYLRWNQTDTKWDGFDDPTYPGGPDGPMRVNSQAWVFYNLQPDGRTPDLSEGTVLRFVYDVRKNTFSGIADDEDGYAWPKPHNYAGHGADKHFGMFLADHGHT